MIRDDDPQWPACVCVFLATDHGCKSKVSGCIPWYTMIYLSEVDINRFKLFQSHKHAPNICERNLRKCGGSIHELVRYIRGSFWWRTWWHVSCIADHSRSKVQNWGTRWSMRDCWQGRRNPISFSGIIHDSSQAIRTFFSCEFGQARRFRGINEHED